MCIYKYGFKGINIKARNVIYENNKKIIKNYNANVNFNIVNSIREKDETQLKSNNSEKAIKVATSMIHIHVLEIAKPEVEKLGYKLDIVVIDDFVFSNTVPAQILKNY